MCPGIRPATGWSVRDIDAAFLEELGQLTDRMLVRATARPYPGTTITFAA